MQTPMQRTVPYHAGELLQASITIAAVALALGTFAEDTGPIIKGVSLLQTVLLFGGICGIASSLYALRDMRLDFQRARHPIPDHFFLIEAGLWVTSAAHVGVLIANLP